MVRFDRPWTRRPPQPLRRSVAALGVLALVVSGLCFVVPPAAAAGDDIRATLPGAMAERTVIAASGTSLLVSTTGGRIPDKVSTDNGATFVPFTPTIPPHSTIVHVAHGKVIWATADGSTTLYTYDFGNTAPVKKVMKGWVEAVDAHTAVLRSDAGGVTTRSAQDLFTGEVHLLPFGSPTDSSTARTTVDVADGSLVLATTTTTNSQGLTGDGYLDLQPANGKASSTGRVVVPGLVAAVLRGDQVVYVTAAAAGLAVCFRDELGWANPSCRPFTVPGLTDPLSATAALSVGADWVLITPRWGSGSQAQLVVGGTKTPAAPVAVVTPAADRALVFTAGDSVRPLASVWKGDVGYIGQVAANGTIAKLFAHPTSPAAVASLRLTPDRLVGLDNRPGGNTSEYQAWQRAVGDTGIGPETLLSPRVVGIGASSSRTLVDDGTKLRVFDAGRATGTLTPPKYGVSAESLSGPYFYGRTVAYDEVLRIDGAVQRKGQVRALFGSQALMLTNASLNRYEVVDVTSRTSVRVQVPAVFEPASFDALGLWGDYVLGFNTLDANTPTVVVLNYRTHQYWQHAGFPIEVGDGFVVLQVAAGTTDRNSDDELAVWNLRTGAVTRMPDRDWQAVATDGNRQLAYTTGSQLVVRHLTGLVSAAPRVLGVVAPAGLNLITGTATWNLALDATKALAAGTVTIENTSGAVVRQLPVAASAEGAVRGVAWDGSSDAAHPVPVGTYRWRLRQTAGDGSGNLVGVDGSAGVTGTIAVARSPLGTVAGSVPTLSDRTPVVGQLLVAREGTWTPSGGLGFTYRWYRSGASASIGDGRTYRLTPADLGKRVRVAVTGSVQHWTSTTTVSASSGKVGKGTLGAPVPTIDHPAAKVGMVLTARPGAWTPASTVPSYRWYRVSASGRSTALKGQTAATLTVARSLAGYRLKVKVTGRLTGYTTRSVYSARTSKVTRS